MNQKLAALRRAKDSGESAEVPAQTSFRKRSQLAILLLTILSFCTLALLVWLSLDRLMPAREAIVETVLSIEGEGTEPTVAGSPSAANPFEGNVLFQASGWVEADPFVHKATALFPGVVEDVYFLEGQAVQEGDVIARLIDEDAEINRSNAESAHRSALSRVEVAKAELLVAEARLKRSERSGESARRRLAELSDLASRAEAMGSEVIPEQEIVQARLRVRTQGSLVEAVEAEIEVARAEVEKAVQNLSAAEYAASQSKAFLAMRELELERTRIIAPISGIIQRLFAVPGQKKMLAADDPDSATVAWIYDPERLQARIDVPLAEAGELILNQAVLIETELLPDVQVRGHVSRIVGEADLQRNTLQAKVRLEQPDERLRPEVLCRAKFLDTRISLGSEDALANDPTTRGGSKVAEKRLGGLRLFIPEASVSTTDNQEGTVFIVDESGKRLAKRRVRLGSERRGDYVEVLSGLLPGDRVLVENIPSFKDGNRIKPVMK